ncbi:hypothetical protein [Streptomyces acidicola]|uniref:hypothetical protein n=1 Tax=Streptomyces acidicola TaxID=2596892 RepID=UPI0022402210|nr:hypothetical protein [Streptomyces acidicola]
MTDTGPLDRNASTPPSRHRLRQDRTVGPLTRNFAATASTLPNWRVLGVWRPFEQLKDEVREAMWDAAATALQMAADGLITARGRLSSALQAPLHDYVYDGDEPSPHRNAWQDFTAAFEEALTIARTDRPPHGSFSPC